MNNNDLEKCPYCGETEMCKGWQWSYASVFPVNTKFRGGSAVVHIICANCGTIVRSYVKDVEKLK